MADVDGLPGLGDEEHKSTTAPKAKAPPKKRGEPAGSTTPKAEGPSKLLRGLRKVGEPISPKEARDGLYYSERSFAAIVRSRAFDPYAPRQGEPLTRESFDVAGDQLAHVANHIFPPLRLLMRATPPLVLAGEMVRINAQILEEVGEGSWFNRFRRQPGQTDQYPYVVPDFEQTG